MPVHNGDKWLSRLKRMRDISSVADDWANDSAAIVAEEARRLVDEGGIPSPNHVVSAPGSPPNTDTGNLASLIQPHDLPEIGHAAAISSADYALVLEFGGSNMAERPYMRVASANKKQAVIKDAAERLKRHTRTIR